MRARSSEKIARHGPVRDDDDRAKESAHQVSQIARTYALRIDYYYCYGKMTVYRVWDCREEWADSRRLPTSPFSFPFLILVSYFYWFSLTFVCLRKSFSFRRKFIHPLFVRIFFLFNLKNIRVSQPRLYRVSFMIIFTSSCTSVVCW